MVRMAMVSGLGIVLLLVWTGLAVWGVTLASRAVRALERMAETMERDRAA